MRKILYVALIASLCVTACRKNNVIAPVDPVVPATPGRSLFVSEPTGSDNNTGLSATTPFKRISSAAEMALPGDTVYIMNGTYAATTGSILNMTKSGAPGRYITFKPYPGHSIKITASGNVWNTIVVNGSYIVIEGFELQGDNANITYAAALASYNQAFAGASVTNAFAKFNTNGITVGGPAAESKFPHHVTIRNCKIHDFPGAGITAIQTDYNTIEGCTVYYNAWYMMYAGSGISILTPFDSDANTSYKNIVRNNIVYGNKCMIPWIKLVPAGLSDGNGIIIDVNHRPYIQSSGPAYNGRTLVENNVSYNNGGSGIHAFDASHVDIVNNTAFNNGQVVDYADIFANTCSDVKIGNNIMYAKNGGRCNSNSNNTFVAYDYNIYYNGTVAIKGLNDKIMDPKFVNASVNPMMANFSLNSGSPAIDAGTRIIYSAKDIMGISRPLGANVDCGAYEIK